MKISYDFLEKILEVPALRLQAFAATVGQQVELDEEHEVRALLIYAHLLHYAPPEIAGLMTTRVISGKSEVVAISVVNKTGLVVNGDTLWDITTAKELDPTKLQGIYEQHGLDLVEYSRLLAETFKDVAARQAQRRTSGAPRGAPVPAPSGAPAGPAVSHPDPVSA